MNVLLAAVVLLVVSGFLALVAGRFAAAQQGPGGRRRGRRVRLGSLSRPSRRRDPRVDRVARVRLGRSLRIVLRRTRSLVGVVRRADLRDLRLECDLWGAVPRRVPRAQVARRPLVLLQPAGREHARWSSRPATGSCSWSRGK